MTSEQKKRARQWLLRQDGRQHKQEKQEKQEKHKQEKPHRLLNA